MVRLHRETKKRRSNLKFVCDKQTDRQTESTTKNNRLLARRGHQKLRIPGGPGNINIILHALAYLLQKNVAVLSEN